MSSQRERITARAHELWVERGKPIGSPEIDWAEAEKEILGDATDPTQAQATPGSPRPQRPDVVTSESDKGPVATDTAGATPPPLPEGSMSKRPRPGKNAGRPARNGGTTRDH